MSVGLVVMIMLMFAEVFRSATGMITTQKGMAENDGRERTIQTIMLNDFKKRTFQELIPFQNGHDTRLLKSLASRQGYFAISENDPNNNTDDVIAFTIRSNIVEAGLDSSIPFYGRTTSLQNTPVTGITAGSGATGTFDVGVDLVAAGYLPATVRTGDKINIQGATPSTVNGVYTIANYNVAGTTTFTVFETVLAGTGGTLYLSRSLGNEPEFDDGQFLINNTGLSTTAEVCYYLRNGNLYRRQLLIREPHDPQTDPSAPEKAGVDGTGSNLLINGDYTVTGNSFWRDFDYSAHRIVGEDVNENGILDSGEDLNTNGAIDGEGMRFHVAADLSNAGSGVVYSLGIPSYRYGHAPSLNGVPREFIEGPDGQPGVAGVDDNNNGVTDDYGEWGWPGSDDVFIGRFTQQETANVNFGYPGYINPGLNPMNRGGLAINPATGAVSDYEGLDRRGEDIIATNVHEFDIKVFAADFGIDGAPGVAGVDDDGDGFIDWLDAAQTIPDLEEVGVAGSDDLIDFYDLGRADNVAAPQVSGLYTANMNANWSYGNRFDTWHVNAGGAAPYRLRSNGEDKRAGLANWDDDDLRFPKFVDWELGPDGLPGQAGIDDDGDGFADSVGGLPIDGADGAPGVAGVDDDGNSVIDDLSERGWRPGDDQVDTDELGMGIGLGSDDIPDRLELGFIGTDDEVPLRAIQIRIRFMDAASNQMRQMTMVFS
ncbi:MAG: hypothetical protein WD065_06910, partial [Planctomycetaceae bacterium]